MHQAMNTTNSSSSSSSSPSDATDPVRILVQTKMHLIPSNDPAIKTRFILDKVCRDRWNHSYQNSNLSHWGSYNSRFSFVNRRCYFVIDHGEAASVDDVPVVWYKWTGKALRFIPQAPPLKMREKLKKQFPFRKAPPKDIPMGPPPSPSDIQTSIWMKVVSGCERPEFSERELGFLGENPEGAKWLREHLLPSFWEDLVAIVEQT